MVHIRVLTHIHTYIQNTFANQTMHTNTHIQHKQHTPVLGCTQKGDFNKWFKDLLTFTSKRGYVYEKTIAIIKNRRSFCVIDDHYYIYINYDCF